MLPILRSQTPVHDISALFEEPLWAEVYCSVCCDTGEAPQITKAENFRDALMAQNSNGLAGERLSLRGLRVGPTAISCLALHLRDRPITWLDLGNNQLGDRSMTALRSVLASLPRLRWLGLAGNLATNEGVSELAEELRFNTSLETVVLGAELADRQHGGSFKASALGAEGLGLLLRGLTRNARSALTSLSLCRSSLDAAAARVLAEFLERDKGRLAQLNLSFNPLTSEGVCAVLRCGAFLRSLSVADTSCRGELIQTELCGLLGSSTRLASICLAQNPLEVRPLRRIARAAAACPSLKSLGLECTSLDAESVTALCDAFLAAPVQSLRELDLRDNQLSLRETATSLAHLVSRTKLQVLRLSRNPLGDAGVIALAAAFDPSVAAATPPLRCLELNSCRLGIPGATHLLSCLAENATLRSLSLADNYLDESLDLRFLDNLQHMQELQLAGNRLSRTALLRASQVCAANKQREREREPAALRAAIKQLLPEESRLESARRRVGEDEADLASGREDAERTQLELRRLRNQAQEHQSSLKRQLGLAEISLRERRGELDRVSRELAEVASRWDAQRQQLRTRLQQREQELAALQAATQGADGTLQRRKLEHPREVLSIKARIDAAVEETEQLQKSAANAKKSLQALQQRTLLDYKP